MKKLVMLLVLACVILPLSGSAEAGSDIFSLNFYTEFPDDAETADVDESENTVNVMIEADQSAGMGSWNTTGWVNRIIPWGLSGPQSQTIKSNANSTATFIFKDVRNGGPYAGVRTVMLGDGNADMMDGNTHGTEDPYDRSAIFDMEVSGIGQVVYDVIIYLGCDGYWGLTRTGNIVFNDGPVQKFTLPDGRFDGTFTEIVDATTPGNYVVYKGVSGSSFTVQVWGDGFNHIGPTGFQFGITDTTAATVGAGSDWVTWSGEPVALNDVLVTNNDGGAGNVTLTWSAEAVAGVSVGFSDVHAKEPVVTFTRTVDNHDAIPVTLKLLAEQNGKADRESSMIVDVYYDQCKASVGTGTTSIGKTDFYSNCKTDVEDLEKMIEAWMVNYSLENPEAKK